MLETPQFSSILSFCDSNIFKHLQTQEKMIPGQVQPSLCSIAGSGMPQDATPRRVGRGQRSDLCQRPQRCDILGEEQGMPSESVDWEDALW